MSRILIVEDEPNLALGLRVNLEIEGHEVEVADNGERALEFAGARTPELTILDLMLPGISGYDVLSNFRARGINTPVLILSARAEEVDKVRGFRAGADDYVTKPFGVMELLLRVQALLRRSAVTAPPSASTRFVGDVEIDFAQRIIKRSGTEITLTPRAFELLAALLESNGRTLTRHELLRTVWGYDGSVTTRTVDAHIAELRRKLEAEPGEPRHIITVHKIGYRLKL